MSRRLRVIDGDLGARVRLARQDRGWRLREFAEHIGMSASALSEFERGRTMPATARVRAISAALDLPADLGQPRAEPAFAHWRDYPDQHLDPVMQAGLDIFSEYGYHGATVRMIAERAGLSVSGVYHYVEGKQQLLRALLSGAMAELSARAFAAEAEGTTSRERLSNVVEAVSAFSMFRQDWQLLAANELHSLDRRAQAHQIQARLRVRGMIEGVVIDCRRERGRATVPAGPTARAIVTMCVAIADWYDPATSPPARQTIAHYVALADAMVTA